MSIKFGISPIAWSNDDLPEMGGDTTLETCLEESRIAGYSGTEAGGKFPMEPTILGPLLKKHQLKLVSGWYSGGLLENDIETEKKLIAKQLDTFKALDVPLMVYGETTSSIQTKQNIPVSQRRTLDHDVIKRYAEKLSIFSEYMWSEGMPLSFHHHMGTVIETEEEVDLLMEYSSDKLGLLLDTGHIAYAGGDPLSVIKKHGKRITHVHMKDIRADILKKAKAEDLSFLDAILAGVFTVPGDGMIDYQKVADALKLVNYSGWVIVEAEQDPVKAPPLEYSRMGFQHLDKVFSKAGFNIVK
jgi:inosose dehydratase